MHHSWAGWIHQSTLHIWNNITYRTWSPDICGSFNYSFEKNFQVDDVTASVGNFEKLFVVVQSNGRIKTGAFLAIACIDLKLSLRVHVKTENYEQGSYLWNLHSSNKQMFGYSNYFLFLTKSSTFALYLGTQNSLRLICNNISQLNG